MLTSISHMPMNVQKTIIEERLADWQGDLEQLDDIILMGIRFKEISIRN